jgi:tRNA isopentenyl-2-thiomethyl-A-37 hydroxylase MiaE
MTLFDEVRRKGLFWSYDPEIEYDSSLDGLLAETVMKYGDMEMLVELFDIYEAEELKKFWIAGLRDDQRFIRTNLMLARVFFGMDVQADYFKGRESERSRKLRLLAS